MGFCVTVLYFYGTGSPCFDPYGTVAANLLLPLALMICHLYNRNNENSHYYAQSNAIKKLPQKYKNRLTLFE